MSYRIRRRRTKTRSLRAFATPLHVERLEDRRMLSAASAAPEELSRLLVGYHSDAASVDKVEVPHAASLPHLLDAYRADPAVSFAEPDFRVQKGMLPNDAHFTGLWGLHNTGQFSGSAGADIRAPQAWDITTGSTATAVAIIDSGIDYTHPDLYLNIWINQGEIPGAVRSQLLDVDGDSLITFRDLNDPRNQGTGKANDLNGNGYVDAGDLLFSVTVGGWADGVSNNGDRYIDDLVGWNFVNNTNNPFDDDGHGTHVAGILGAVGHNGLGIAGVSWNTLLVGLKFLDANGGGYVSGAVDALHYAVSQGIPVSNNSWGGTGYSQSLYNAIGSARAQGHLFVTAAGNGGADALGDDNDTAGYYPAGYNLDNVIAVAATDHRDRLAVFSNFGAKTVDIAAPGVSILSTVPGGYARFSGTSMAAPFVSGAAALVLGHAPGLPYTQMVTQLLNGGDKLPQLAGKVSTSARLNAFEALKASAVDRAGPRIVAAEPNGTGSRPVSSVRLTFSEAIHPATFTLADITRFTGPNGRLAATGVVPVAGSGHTQFDITFASQSTPGAYSILVGPHVQDVAGNLMDQNQDGIAGEPLTDGYTVQFTVNSVLGYTSNPYSPIFDRTATIVSMHVDRPLTIADLNVRLDISHTYDADLNIRLVGPDGTHVPLVRFRGGGGDHFGGTLLDDEAPQSIASGRAPFSGSFRPEGRLSAFDGKSAQGIWKLWVEDWYRGDTGRLKSWSLVFEAVGAAAQYSATASPAQHTLDAAPHQAPALLAQGRMTDPAQRELASRPDVKRVPELAMRAAAEVPRGATAAVLASWQPVAKRAALDKTEVEMPPALTGQDALEWASAVDHWMASGLLR